MDETSGLAENRRSWPPFGGPTYDAYGAAATAIEVDGETIDRLSAFARLATAEDAAERRAVFEAMAPVWRAVDGDGGVTSPHRRLVAASAERWVKAGSTIEANAAVLGIAPGAFEPMLHAILADGRRVVADAAGLRPGGRVEPWDYRFVVGAVERRLRAAVPARPAVGRSTMRISARWVPIPMSLASAMTSRRNSAARSSRSPSRPTAGPGPWVFATYREGGLGNLTELLHESGARDPLTPRVRTAARVRTSHPASYAAFFEAVGRAARLGCAGAGVHRPTTSASPSTRTSRRSGPVWRGPARCLLGALRGGVHRSPGRQPNDVWAEVVADGLGIEPHPEWSWWAGPRPAHREPRLPRQLRPGGHRGGRTAGTHHASSAETGSTGDAGW